jgi:catechol 2,3-dioxygenase-like lactoylglutathione lyase family enzyme
MPSHTGVDHFTLTVTDLQVSTQFYADVMGMLPLLDFGYGRLLIDRRTGFTIAVALPPDAAGGPFTHLTTGLDHLGFGVDSLEELVAWERHLEAHGVEYTPIRDMGLAHHLNFRDPDNVALEITASSETYAAAMRMLREGDMTDEEIRDYAAQMMGPELVIGR